MARSVRSSGSSRPCTTNGVRVLDAVSYTALLREITKISWRETAWLRKLLIEQNLSAYREAGVSFAHLPAAVRPNG